MKLSFLVKAPSGAPPAPVKAPSVVPSVASATPAKAETSPVAPVKAEPAPAAPVKASSEPEAPSREQEPAATASEAPTPRPRRRVAKSGASLSLNSIEEESKEKVTSSAVNEDDDMPDEEAVKEAWKELPEYCAKQPRLCSTLQNAEYSISEKDGCKFLTFKVDNIAQQSWIRERQLHALEGYLQKKIGSTKIRLDVDVKPTEQKEMAPYTDEEKAKALMKENVEVGSLIKDFGLETK